MSVTNITCTTDMECDLLYCIDGYCACHTNYFLVQSSCRRCPGLGKSCSFSQCCEDASMRCDSYNFCVCKYYAESSTTCRSQLPLYITASQIALSAALIMGMAALTMVVYRLCTKPRYPRARQRAIATQSGINADSDSLTYANYLRASLSSMQIRVLSRLRDRPPAYGSSQARRPPVSLPEAPPPYEGPSEGNSLPPNYTDIILSPVGFVNSTFVDTEGGGSLNTNSDTTNNSNRQNSDCDNDRPSDGSSEVDKVTECSIEDKAETTEEIRIPT